jgi:hypothetical protein
VKPPVSILRSPQAVSAKFTMKLDQTFIDFVLGRCGPIPIQARPTTRSTSTTPGDTASGGYSPYRVNPLNIKLEYCQRLEPSRHRRTPTYPRKDPQKRGTTLGINPVKQRTGRESARCLICHQSVMSLPRDQHRASGAPDRTHRLDPLAAGSYRHKYHVDGLPASFGHSNYRPGAHRGAGRLS